MAAGVVFVATIGFLVWYAALRPSPGCVPPTPSWLGALPLVGAAVALPVLGLGELTWPRPRGTERVANLNPRTIQDLVPRAWAVTTSGLALVAVVLVLAGVWVADGSGRSITALNLPDGRGSAISGPFPGARHGGGPPPYEQVRAQLAGLIRAGALRPGDKLPV